MREDEDDNRSSVPRWIEEYHKCLKSPQARKNRAAIAISVIEKQRRTDDAVTLGNRRARPPKLGPSKKKAELAKATELDRSNNVAISASPPTTPRENLSQPDKPTVQVVPTTPAKNDDNARTAALDCLPSTKPPKTVISSADTKPHAGKDQVQTSEGARRKPPKLGRPKAEAGVEIPTSTSAKAKTEGPTVEIQSGKAESNKSELGPKDLKQATPMVASGIENGPSVTSTTAVKPSDRAEQTVKTALESTDAEAGTRTANPEPDGSSAEAGDACTVSDTVKAGTTRTAPKLTTASNPETEDAVVAASEDTSLRMPRPGTPKPEEKIQVLDFEAETPAPNSEFNDQKVERSVESADLDQLSNTNLREAAGDSVRDSPRPRLRPPKLGRPKAELESQKPKKLSKNDGRSAPKKPYAEHGKLGEAKLQPAAKVVGSEPPPKEADDGAIDGAPKKSPPRLEGKNHRNNDDVLSTSRARPPKLGKPKKMRKEGGRAMVNP